MMSLDKDLLRVTGEYTNNSSQSCWMRQHPHKKRYLNNEE
jgi:hypothetical protein